MNPILPEQSAREECLKLIEELDSSPLGVQNAKTAMN